MAAGALAGSATVLITNPIWVVNTRMTARKKTEDSQELPGPGARKHSAPSTIGTFLQIIQEEGVGRLFAGVMPALVLVINPILQYTLFEQLKNVVEKRRRMTPTDSFYLGALGKLLATSITYPYITVKSRMHVAGKDGPKENMFESFNRIVREEGWGGLYGGEHNPSFEKMTMLTTLKVLDQRSPKVSLPLPSYSPLRMRCTMSQSRPDAQSARRRNFALSSEAETRDSPVCVGTTVTDENSIGTQRFRVCRYQILTKIPRSLGLEQRRDIEMKMVLARSSADFVYTPHLAAM